MKFSTSTVQTRFDSPLGRLILAWLEGQCHRVIGANGALTGDTGGLQHKVVLLQLEGAR